MPRDDSVDRSLEVLVVDDDPDVRELLEEFFREMEFVVATAKDGRAAISAVEREPHRYWLVITDIVMPGADGLAVLRAVKTASPSVQVVIMTGYASLDTAIEAVRLGAADYLPKPFTLGQIEVMVRRLMERLHLESQNREMADTIRVNRVGDDDRLVSRMDSIGVRLGRLEKLIERLSV